MVLTSRVARRWSVPALAAVAVAGFVVAPRAAAASAHPSLPPRSAAALIAAAEQTHVQALSGTVQTTANLGLPQLPDRIGNAGSGLQAMLTGTHQLRVWIDGPDRQRIALLGDLAETDVIHNGADLWTYTSSTGAVTHRTLTAMHARSGSDRKPGDATSPEQQLTPQAQADKALKAIDPSTLVSVDRTARVAGRPAYQLVLTPRTTATLVRSVHVAIDAATSVPLRVQIFAADSSKPAFETGFTTVSFHRPAASLFRFVPPPGAHVATTQAHERGTPNRGAEQRSNKDATKPQVIGKGWAAILELPAGTLSTKTTTGVGTAGGDVGAGSLLDRVTRPVPQGRLLTTRLLTALITPDGRVFVGAVPASALQQAAGA